MGKEVLDLLDSDLGQIRVVLDAVVALSNVARGYRDDLLVLAGIVLHDQHADRAHAHDRAGNDRARVRDEHIARVAVPGAVAALIEFDGSVRHYEIIEEV
jgi:hypothetical protein